MILYCVMSLEGPVRMEGEVLRIGRIARDLPKLIRLGFRVTIRGEQETGAWEQENLEVKRIQLDAELSPEKFEEVVNLFDLETDGSEGCLMGGPFGFGSGGTLSFQGTCRFGEHRPVDELLIADAHVIPYPAFEPVNRAKDEAWMRRAWARLKRAIVRRWGTSSAKRRFDR